MADAMMFVDDEPDLRFLAAQFFEMAGHKLLTAANSAEALEVSKNIPLRAIVLDANLTGEGSASLLKALKQSHPQTPVIIYSGQLEDDDAIKALLSQGADKYLLKDGSLGTLLQTVLGASAA